MGGVRGGARERRPRSTRAAAAAAERTGGLGACGRLRGVRAAVRRAGGRCARGHAGGSSGARGRPRGVRAVPPRGRAGRETGCPGNGGKRGLVRGQTSVMAATECVGNALFCKVLFPVISSLMRTVPCLMWDN